MADACSAQKQKFFGILMLTIKGDLLHVGLFTHVTYM